MFLHDVWALLQLMKTHVSRQPLVLRPGQVVTGQIVEQLGSGDVVVIIDGQRLRANTEVPLTAERRYWFQIQSNQDRLVLKVLERDGGVIQDGRQMAEVMLRNWGLKPTNENRRAVEWLLRLNGPLTRQNVEQLASVFRTYGKTPVLERALSLAISKNLPLQPSIVEAIARAVSGEGLVHRLSDLAHQLQQWMHTDSTSPAFVKERVQQVVKQLEQALAPFGSRQNGLTIPSGTNPPLSQAGSQPELRLGTEQPAVNVNKSPQALGTAQDQLSLLRWWTSGDQAGQTFKSVFHKWLQAIGVDREQSLLQYWRISKSGDTFKAFEPNNVKEGVIRLLQLPLPSYVRESADAVLQHITGQQLLLSATHDHQWQHLLLYVPMHQSRSQEVAIHVFTRKRAGGALDQDNCRLLFQLELDRLGWSCLVVHIVNRAVSVEWYCDHEHLAQQLEKAEPFLRERLERVGYTLSHVKARRGKELGTERKHPVWPTIVNWGKGVDVRV